MASQAFSRKQSKLDAISIKIRRAKLQARKNNDYKIKRPAETRDANKGDYTLLVKRITEETIKDQERNEKFRSKLHAK